jgi:hypothetical protein
MMKSTGYEYECEQLVKQAAEEWRQATDLDPMLDDTSVICTAKLLRLNQAEKLLADARLTAYYVRNGIAQDEAITEILTRIEQYKCRHEHTTDYLAGDAPDNYWLEEYCDKCGALVDTDNYILAEKAGLR